MQNRLFNITVSAALALGVVLGAAIATQRSTAQEVRISPPIQQATPGYVTGRFYPAVNITTASGTAITTLDTVVWLVPFSPPNYPLAATSMNIRTVTGAVSCAVKMAVWASGPTTKRPTGTSIAGSNTGQACTANGSNASISISYTFAPGVQYWYGAAVTTGAAQFVSITNTTLAIDYQVGIGTISNQSVSALTAPYAYATDITALDLTSASFTDQTGSTGVPLVRFGT